ncbi:hypothetical protein LTR62_007514 [Meristemomyces frigidus]|uniref:Uncharacterized protein n=1 Tax=Meristemomyces frigidus TaxID=1508187 RepID=A0AAN7TC35_9PEZI|nr:hypothetical protein LTR62_007514 [Meristemomyces frigidus]
MANEAVHDAPYHPQQERLSIPYVPRLLLSQVVGGIAGFGLGISQGGLMAGLRFRAENAHRFPTTQTGWYLYHKSKNYHIALGAVQEGLKMAGKLALWTGVFMTMEEGVDRARTGVMRRWTGFRGTEDEERTNEINRDFVSTLFAGLGTAGAFSAWNRFPIPTAVRTARLGAKYGLMFGLVEDVLSLLKGRRLGYVEFVKKWTFGASTTMAAEAGVAG